MKKQILDDDELEQMVSRISSEILKKNSDLKSLMIIGLKKRGDILAKKIATKIEATEGVSIPTSAIDITFYRDDVHLKAYKYVVKGEIPSDVTGKNIILVDDVIFTGRSIRAAIDELMDAGRPKSIQLAVLIDRGSRELPIQPDYVGKKIAAGPESDVSVRLREIDGEDAAFVSPK